MTRSVSQNSITVTLPDSVKQIVREEAERSLCSLGTYMKDALWCVESFRECCEKHGIGYRDGRYYAIGSVKEEFVVVSEPTVFVPEIEQIAEIDDLSEQKEEIIDDASTPPKETVEKPALAIIPLDEMDRYDYIVSSRWYENRKRNAVYCYIDCGNKCVMLTIVDQGRKKIGTVHECDPDTGKRIEQIGNHVINDNVKKTYQTLMSRL